MLEVVTYNNSMDILSQLQKELGNERIKQFPKDQILLYQGDIPSEVYILHSGIIKIFDIDDQGNEKILHIVAAPAILPLAFFSHNDHEIKWFYTTITECSIQITPQEQLRQALAKNGTLATTFMAWFSREVHEVLVRLSSLSKTQAYAKIAAALTFLAVRHSTIKRGSWRRVTFPVSHQLLGDLTGITRERATITMKQFQDEGIIRSPQLTVLEINFKKLMALS